MYGVYPRGWGKTFNEVIIMFIACVLYPGIEFALTAQTKENAAELLKNKYNDILKKYPWFKNEIYESKFSKNDAEITFLNNSRIDVLANSQSSKGQRRNIIMIEESALLDDFTFQDALLPIVEHGRITVGSLAIINPEEPSQKINFYTTAGFRGSDEYERNLRMVDDMINLNGQIVIGSDWHLGCWYGRGSTKKQIMYKKRNMSPIAFAQNYESKWVGSVDGALVDILKLLKLRVLPAPELECPKDKNGNYELCEYCFGIDVARSNSDSNNKTVIAVLKIIRNDNGSINEVQLVNIIVPPNGLNYEEQAIEVKKIFKKYGGNIDLVKSRVKAVIVDINIIGQGLLEELLKDNYDPVTNEKLECWATINTDDKPKVINSPNIVYGLKAQGINGDIIRIFIGYIESGKLKLVRNLSESEKGININNKDTIEIKQAYKQTDYFIDEISNLKLRKTQNSVTVDQVVRRVDKDRYSAVAMGLYYIDMFLNEQEDNTYSDDDEIVYF